MKHANKINITCINRTLKKINKLLLLFKIIKCCYYY